MMRIIVTGKDGQLGSEFKKIEKDNTDFTFFFSDYKGLDITDGRSVLDYFEKIRPNVVINCAAYTAVDKAEVEAIKAKEVNDEGVKNLVKASEKVGCRLVHISTDYVFDGSNNVPYKESDEVNPLGVYGETKRLGELAVLNALCPALIIRTSWVYSSFGNNFVKTMLRYGNERDELKVVYDQIGSPTYAKDLAEAILVLVRKSDKWPKKPTLYHFTNEGVISWYDFSRAIMDIKKIPCKVSPILSEDYPSNIERPHFSVLDKAAIKKDFSIQIPYWRDSLIECLALLA